MEIGKLILDLKPSENNPRNSEGAFLCLDNGDILFVYSRYKGSDASDFATADICKIVSHDRGETFSDQEIIVTCEQENAINIMSVSLMKMKNGDIGLFYLIRTNPFLLRMYLRRSSDNGKTWSTPLLCTAQEDFFVVNNDRVVRLSNGNIIIPAASHRTGHTDITNTKGSYFDSRAEAVFFISTDDGFTWHVSHDKCSIHSPSFANSGLQEPGLIELKNGVLWGFARTELGRQYEMFSLDGGETWTQPQPSRFTSPCSPMSMKRMKSGEILAIWNPIPNYNGRKLAKDLKIWNGGRTPFVFAVSRDDGKTFSTQVEFENDERSGYCYCAIYFVDDFVLLAYCAGGEADGSTLSKTRIRKINVADILNLTK